MQNVTSLRSTFIILFSFVFFQTVNGQQKPGLSKDKVGDSTTHGSVRAANFKKEQQEAEKEAIAKKEQQIQDEKDVRGGHPQQTAVKDFPPGTPAFITDSLDAYVERGLALWQIPGLAIAIIKDGKVILSKGYGVKEVNRFDKVDENTLFIIASNTKLFTGTSLAKLDFEKKLSLSDKVTKYIPWFRLYDSNSTRLATVRDMLCHRIGLKTFEGDFTFWDSNLPKDSIIWKLRYLKPAGEFRQDYGYCNSGFLVAGRILEKVTGNTWENYVSQNILQPLGMTNTYMNTAGIATRPNVALAHNNLYGPLTVIPYDSVDNLGPATSMVSNVKDLSKWIMMQLDSGRYNGQQVIPWPVIQKTRDVNILTGSRKSAAFPTHFRGYGLGVFVTDYAGRQVYWHTGGAFGEVTNVCFVPEEKLGITILTNNDNQSFFEALRYQILDAYMGVPYTDRSKFQYGFFVQGKKQTDDELAAMQDRVSKSTAPVLKIDDYTGTFYNTVYGKVTITKSGNELVCHFQRHPYLLGKMEYMDNNEFRMTYSNIGYGIYPAKYTVVNGKATAVEIKANDFVESDSYLFVRDPRNMLGVTK
jgi:CubicO group peptidase (beta-lactamase class C family)